MDFLMQKDRRHLALVPCTSMDEERIRALRTYDPFQVSVTFTRTSRLNRWYRGLVGKVAEAIGTSPDLLHNDLKFKAGLILQILPVRAGGLGSVAVRLQSTAFPLMEDATFSHYCDTAVELLHHDYLPQIREREWQKLIVEWAGRRPRLDPPRRAA